MCSSEIYIVVEWSFPVVSSSKQISKQANIQLPHEFSIYSQEVSESVLYAIKSCKTMFASKLQCRLHVLELCPWNQLVKTALLYGWVDNHFSGKAIMHFHEPVTS